MSGHRIDRIEEDIKRELTAIVTHVKDPRVRDKLVTILRVEVTKDLSYAKVYVSSLDGLERSQDIVSGLKAATGFIKRELGLKLKLRHIPELIFCATNSIEYGVQISEMLQELM